MAKSATMRALAGSRRCSDRLLPLFVLLATACALWTILLLSMGPSYDPSFNTSTAVMLIQLVSVFRSGVASAQSRSLDTLSPSYHDPCAGNYVYIHRLPRRFNTDMLRRCRTLDQWTDMCAYKANAGLGPSLGIGDEVVDPQGSYRSNSSGGGWYITNQFSLEVIFHERMKRYRCLTKDPRKASAVFVPFYAGLDVGRYLWGGHNTSVRDAMPRDLAQWLRLQPEWKAMDGRDHFFVGGRIIWDFLRPDDLDASWGNKLLRLPEIQNVTALVLESNPWVEEADERGDEDRSSSSNDRYDNGNTISVPYPTYFHPSRVEQVSFWQDSARKSKRPWLFSFAGAPRRDQTQSIRGQIMAQCRESRFCSLLDCDKEWYGQCHSPASLMKLFGRSVFCLQPQGDSFTRRSIFDAMVAGCVPVFFHRGSAYSQYPWHLPFNHSSYSVFIPEDRVRDGTVSLEDVLTRVGDQRAAAMREEVIRMIPRLIYADPRAPPSGFEDAFDVAVDGVLTKILRFRNKQSS